MFYPLGKHYKWNSILNNIIEKPFKRESLITTSVKK